VLAGALAAVLAAPAPAHACTSLDVSCASSAIEGTAHATVDEAESTVDDEPVSTVDEVVGSASGTVGDVADTVDDTVDDVLGEGAAPPEPGIDRPGPPSTEEGRRRGRDARERVPGRVDAWPGVETSDGRDLAAPVGSAPSLAPASAPAPPSRTTEGFRDAIAAAAPSLVVLVALFGLVMAFLLVQSWMDRRDPRLAAAPPTDEIAWFR